MILALEFSSEHREIALWEHGHLVGTCAQADPVSTLPMELLDSLLTRVGRRVEEISVVAIGLGPGSYTGIRVAISVAQGFAIAGSARISAHSSFEVLVQGLSPKDSSVTHVAVDAQRGEFAVSSIGPGRRVGDPRLLKAEELMEMVAGGDRILGPRMAESAPGCLSGFPRAEVLAGLAETHPNWAEMSDLAPVYLRPVSFVKAAPTRLIP